MSEAKHTPGPYTLDPTGAPAIYEENSPTGHIICLFNAEYRSPEENLANAEFFHRAAVAHDDLLVALKRQAQGLRNLIELHLIPVSHLPDTRKEADALDVLIAKAEGRAK